MVYLTIMNGNWKKAITFFIVLSAISCQKYLDKKPSRSQVVPTKINEFQSLLNNSPMMNNYSNLPVIAADDYYLTNATWSALGVNDREAHVWNPNTNFNAWNAYSIVYVANVVLKGMEEVDPTPQDLVAYNDVKGQALFHRAYAFNYLAQLYSKPYNESTASTDPGIAIRLVPDIEEKSSRATIAVTYNQILNDLKTAVRLLPETILDLSRPNRAAAYGALAKVYLSMREYESAGLYADSSLNIYNKLIDFNTLSTTDNVPIGLFNDEVIFFSEMTAITLVFNTAPIDTTLHALYENNDLRKEIYYRANGLGGYYFKGAYNAGGYNPFNGIATDEMFLIRAESYARLGQTDKAIADLNHLRKSRWKTNTYVDLTVSTPDEAKNAVLLERRRELIFRETRWTDLRRLNMEGYNITLTRGFNGSTLPPNDLRWVWLIPLDVIDLTGMQQNPR